MLRFRFLKLVKAAKNIYLIASLFTSISSVSSSLFYPPSSVRLPDTNVPFIVLFCAVLFLYLILFLRAFSLYIFFVSLFCSSSYYRCTFLLFMSLFATHSSAPSSASFASVPFLFLVSIYLPLQPLLSLLPFFFFVLL